MMPKAWSSIEEVPYCFSRSSVKLQGHTAEKIVEFYPNWAFPDCNSSLNSPMTLKCCTKLETTKERCPIFFPRSSIKFQGHMRRNITDFDPNWAFPDYRPVAAFKSLRFALLRTLSVHKRIASLASESSSVLELVSARIFRSSSAFLRVSLTRRIASSCWRLTSFRCILVTTSSQRVLRTLLFRPIEGTLLYLINAGTTDWRTDVLRRQGS